MSIKKEESRNEYEFPDEYTNAYYEPTEKITNKSTREYSTYPAKQPKKTMTEYWCYTALFLLIASCLAFGAFYLFYPTSLKGDQIDKNQIKNIEKSIETLKDYNNNEQKKFDKKMNDISDTMQNKISAIEKHLTNLTEQKENIEETQHGEVLEELQNKISAMEKSLTTLKNKMEQIQQDPILDEVQAKVNSIEGSVETINERVKKIDISLSTKVDAKSQKDEISAMKKGLTKLTDNINEVQNDFNKKLEEISKNKQKGTVPHPIDSDTVSKFLYRYCREYLTTTSASEVGEMCLEIKDNSKYRE